MKSENSPILQDKIAQKSDYKRVNIELVFVELVDVHNEKFRRRLAEFLFWVLMEAGRLHFWSQYNTLNSR